MMPFLVPLLVGAGRGTAAGGNSRGRQAAGGGGSSTSHRQHTGWQHCSTQQQARAAVLVPLLVGVLDAPIYIDIGSY